MSWHFFTIMFAIFETGGKQYRAEKGSKIRIEKIDTEEGKKVDFDRVFLVSDGKKTEVGAPFVSGAKVSATVVSVGRGEKIRVVRFKPKKRQKTIAGHRQDFTEIEITAISHSK